MYRISPKDEIDRDLDERGIRFERIARAKAAIALGKYDRPEVVESTECSVLEAIEKSSVPPVLQGHGYGLTGNVPAVRTVRGG